MSFAIFENLEQTIKDFEDAGFQGIKAWPQRHNIMWKSGDHFMKAMGSKQLGAYAQQVGLTSEQVEQATAEVIKEFDK